MSHGFPVVPIPGLGAAPAQAAATSRETRILGLRADHFFKVVMPFVGGLLSAGGAVLAYRKGGEKWAIVMLASAGITGAFTSAAIALQEAVNEVER